MYKKPSCFQIAAAISKIQFLQDAEKTSWLDERTLECRKQIFIPMLIENKFLSDLDLSLLDHFFELYKTAEGVKADVIVYLCASPKRLKLPWLAYGNPTDRVKRT